MEEKKKSRLTELGEQVEEFASKTLESLKRRIDKALAERNIVLTIRVNEETNKKLNMLVEAGLFKSRSECAAFLIEEGTRVHKDLFRKIEEKMEKISKLREELRKMVEKEVASHE